MTLKSVIASTALAAGLALSAMSANAEAPIHSRLHHQRHRINQGVGNGSLTPTEAHRLRRHERSIAWRTRRAHRTGHRLSYAERVRLQRSLNRQSQRINRQERDAQRR